MTKRKEIAMDLIAILFAQRAVTGHILVRDAKVTGLRGPSGAKIHGNRFHLPKGGRLEVRLSGLRLEPGAFPNLVQVDSADAPFTFFARDVNSETPIWLPEYRVAVVTGKDARNYRQVAAAIQQRRLQSDFDRFECRTLKWQF